MQLEWDEAKDVANRQKHGLGLEEASGMEWPGAGVEPDDRSDYGEKRFRAYLIRDRRLYVCVFTLRGDAIRVISLRKANTREEKRYVTAGST